MNSQQMKALKQWKKRRTGNTLPRMKLCPECEGRKKVQRAAMKMLTVPCSTCKGKGEVPEMVEVECRCRSKGFGKGHNSLTNSIRRIHCKNCMNTGKIKRPKTLRDLIEDK